MKIMAVAAATLVCASGALAENYRAEAAQLAAEIVEIHPRGAEIASSPDFVAAKAALLAIAGETDLPHYALALGRMFHAVDDGHTAAIPIYSDDPLFTARYPLRLNRFEDGLYVVAAKDAAAPLLGARITRIGGKSVDALLRDFVAAVAAGNRARPANWTATGMTVPGFLMALDAAPLDTAASVDFEGMKNGRKVSAALTAAIDGGEELSKIERKPPPLATSDEARNFIVDKDKALVLVLGAMEDEEGKTFEAFTREAFAALDATKSDRVVIDLRDNGGGNNMLAEPLRRALVKSRFNRPGGMYILISPQTFSAAQNFATRLERETDALFAGEPTGGSPNHFGDAKFAIAPQSGIPYIISTLRWQDSTPFDDRKWILPDIPAPPSFADYAAGRDAALEAALAHEATPADDDWRMRVVKPWDRDSQKRDWRFFYEDG